MDLQLQIEPSLPLGNEPPVRKRFSIFKWLMNRMNATFQYDTVFWRTSLTGVWTVYSIVLIVTILGMPTGLGLIFDILAMTLVGTVGLAIAAVIIAFLLSLLYIPVPRLFAGAVLFTGYIVDYVLERADIDYPQSLILAAIVAGCGILGGLMIGLISNPRLHPSPKIAVITAVTLGCISLSFWPPQNNGTSVTASVQDEAEEDGTAALQSANPSVPGSFQYRSFTYSSGQDRHRDEFGKGTDLVSSTVNASAYIKKWPWLRSFFWGFDQTELPLNGRVWMPEGEGPFPLVLIVHGNHLMEQFSDEGYGYLGELLASRGFIAVSVDENFLNYSVWASIPNQDMKVRAWILLKHLQQIDTFSKQGGNPFSGQVDMKNVALIGHSRGGQAVAMAADSSKWFSDDKSLKGIESYRIGAVIGIAPTDKAVDKRSASLTDTSYMTLQGASDGDVDTFNGERQYIRTTITPGSEAFKTSLYIGEANHSRFNTSWGTMDDSLPGGLLLNRRDMIAANDQRQIAKVYISAFLESALHGSEEYKELFRDYRTGSAWLPDATYINRYEDGSFRELARFDDDYSKQTYRNGVTAKAEDLVWSEQTAEDRDHNGKGTRGAVLEWKANGGRFTMKLPESLNETLRADESANLAFSMTNLERDLKLSNEVPAPSISIELQSRNGAVAMLPLDSFMTAIELPKTTFTIFPWLEKEIKDGKYKEPSEPVFQFYQLPLERFREVNPQFNPEQLSQITFQFRDGPGKIMLDDIGIEAGE
ncbi:alpha/beta hydrolase [Paenibacillus solisilvae]|uniref:Alpha/beta hydrolase n=1 Tax=Paenibacillus solisilvae TaxID=2486751 RepID=A0ABW0VTI5_9BACL